MPTPGDGAFTSVAIATSVSEAAALSLLLCPVSCIVDSGIAVRLSDCMSDAYNAYRVYARRINFCLKLEQTLPDR